MSEHGMFLPTLVLVSAFGVFASTGPWAQVAGMDCVGCVDSKNIANGAVNANKLSDLAVTTPKLRGRAVTAAKLAGDAVFENIFLIRMAFQTRTDLQNQAIGRLRKRCSSLGGGTAVRFP